MKFVSIVRAISPFTKTSNVKSEKVSAASAVNNLETEQKWDLTNVDLKYALKLFYKKFNPEKSFIVSDIIQKYVGEEQLLLQQLQDRYHLSHEEMQTFLSKATTQNHASPSVDNSLHQSHNYSHEETWDVSNVNVASLLQFIYATYNPTRTPNVDVLKQKSQKDILVILRQLCKRHNLSHSDMRDFIERYRGRQSEFNTETKDKKEHFENGSQVFSSDNIDNRLPLNEMKNQSDDDAPRPSSSQSTTPIVSGRRSSVDAHNYQVHSIDSIGSSDTKNRISHQSIRYLPLSAGSGVEQVAKMDEVLRQMNVRQQYSVPPPPPPPKQKLSTRQSIKLNDSSENNSLLYSEIHRLQQTGATQQNQLLELQDLVDKLRVENMRLLEERDELVQKCAQKPVCSVGTQAVDPSLSVDLEQLQLNLHETINANDRFRQDADRLRRKQCEDIERLQQHCKSLQGDRENILQFINALCLHCTPARRLIGAYFNILQSVESIPASNDGELMSDRLDRLLQWIRQQPSKHFIDHRKLIQEAESYLKEQESNLKGAEDRTASEPHALMDITDENLVLQQQFDLAKKLIDNKKKQSRMESRLAEANQLLKQSILSKTVDKLERDFLEVTTHSNESSQLSPEVNSNRTSSPVAVSHQTPVGGNHKKNITPQDTICDWIECIDPKTKRKYYYSPSLKKSTWTRPDSLGSNAPDHFVSSSHIETKTISNEIKSAPRRNLRGASPTPSVQSAFGNSSIVSDHSSSASLFSQRSNSVRYASPNVSLSTGSDWIAAVDPKSGRKYYFNRKTKKSTWRKPVELI